LPAYQNIGKTLIQKVFSGSNSSLLHPGLVTISSGRWEKWPKGGNINYNTILQLDMLCEKEEKWTEVLYIQLFFFLRDHRKWLSKCRLDTQTMVTLYKKPPNSLKEPEPKKPSNAKGLQQCQRGTPL
jgi:hypothetical protein